MERLIQLIKKGEFAKAEALLRKSLASAPKDLYLLTQLANVLWNRHKDKEALLYADEAENISESYPLLFYTRGRILWTLEKYEESMKEWSKILNMSDVDVANNGWGMHWAKSVINDARYYMADCLCHLYRDKEGLLYMVEHLNNRKRGVQSDFSKKEAILFYKVLKYSHREGRIKESDDGYANEVQKRRISKRIDALQKNKNMQQLVRYLKLICKHYPKEYWLLTTLSEYSRTLGKKEECLTYALAAFKEEPYDSLVIYNYAYALWINGNCDEALVQFESIVNLGEDYIAYSEYGEGKRWAKKLLRKTIENINKIKYEYK